MTRRSVPARLVFAAMILLIGTGCPKKKEDDAINPITLLLMSQSATFQGSCDLTAAASNTCQSYYGAPPIASVCTGNGGTMTSTKCSCTGALGMCKWGAGMSSYVITVYPGTYAGGAAQGQTHCSGLGGVFSASCSMP